MCMNPKHIREIQTNEVLRKRLAKYITLHCFRNTDVLEDLHSGEVPISESGDYSDVKVITPDREIPWSDLSRFDNSEMKAMMIDVVNHCDQVLAILFPQSLHEQRSGLLMDQSSAARGGGFRRVARSRAHRV